jgi:hypothetical protein
LTARPGGQSFKRSAGAFLFEFVKVGIQKVYRCVSYCDKSWLRVGALLAGSSAKMGDVV